MSRFGPPPTSFGGPILGGPARLGSALQLTRRSKPRTEQQERTRDCGLILTFHEIETLGRGRTAGECHFNTIVLHVVKTKEVKFHNTKF
jgi:hypothetical protein